MKIDTEIGGAYKANDLFRYFPNENSNLNRIQKKGILKLKIEK